MTNIKLIYKRVLSRFPTNLPVGMAEFHAWADSIIELSGQYADDVSMRFALASMLIHADARYGSLPKNYFVVRLRKTAANQIASQVFQDIKSEQDAKRQPKPVEVTATPEAGNGQTTT